MSKNALRWAIGSSGDLRSSAWRLWGNPKSDIYVAVRVLGGTTKASFHRDGRCQVGFTTEYAPTAGQRFGTGSRHWETWTLPAQPVVRVLRILVPYSELRPFAGRDNADIAWLPVPPEGSIGVVSVFIAAPDVVLEPPETVPSASLIGTVRTSIRNAWAFYAHNPIDEATARMIAEERAKIGRIPTRAGGWPPGTRAALWESRTDHNRHALELACSPLPEPEAPGQGTSAAN